MSEITQHHNNWAELQTQRAQRPDFIRKLWAISSKDTVCRLQCEDPSESFRSAYTEVHSKVTSLVLYSTIEDSLCHTLGRSKYGTPPHLYSNATYSGKTLSMKEKDIVVAHELYHSLVHVESGTMVADLVHRGFKWDNLSDKQQIFHGPYIWDPNEQLARMAQLKNYIGFSDNEVFTADHLEEARKNYVADTGFDNRMTLFFRIIDPESAAFIDTMNRLPI